MFDQYMMPLHGAIPIEMEECNTLRGIIVELKTNILWKSDCCSIRGVYCQDSHIIFMYIFYFTHDTEVGLNQISLDLFLN